MLVILFCESFSSIKDTSSPTNISDVITAKAFPERSEIQQCYFSEVYTNINSQYSPKNRRFLKLWKLLAGNSLITFLDKDK